MPTNLNANKRVAILDRCFRDQETYYALKDLQLAVAEANEKNIIPSPSTISHDIMAMKSGDLGYEAPILYTKELGYHYSNPQFSIFQIHISRPAIRHLGEAFSLLYNLNTDLQIFKLSEIINEVENKLNLQLQFDSPIIQFERSLNENGLKYINEFYQKIITRQAITVQYKHFTEAQQSHIMSPYFLKEYNNRWYIFGFDHLQKKLHHLALDRVVSINNSLQVYRPVEKEELENRFEHLYGVTIFDDTMPQKVVFKTSPLLSNYMNTKPIHTSQKQVHTDEETNWTHFEIVTYINYEIQSKLLSFGEDLYVSEPAELVNKLALRIAQMNKAYARGE